MTILASGLAGPNYKGIVLDATFAYISLNSSGNVAKVAKSGGIVANPLGTGSGSAGGIALDATTVYWTTGTEIRTVPKGGGASSILLSGRTKTPRGIAVDGTNVYWTEQGSVSPFTDGAVYQMPKGGGTITVLASGEHSPEEVIVDATNVYWTNADPVGGAFEYSLKQVVIGGGTVHILASSNIDINLRPTGPSVDASYVYFANPTAPATSGTINRVPIGGGTIDTLASNQNIPAETAIDVTNIYWTNQGDNTVNFVPKGGGTVQTAATQAGTPASTNLTGIAVDGSGIYWNAYTAGTVSVQVQPWASAIVSDSSVGSPNMGVRLSLSAALVADSTSQEIITRPVSMAHDDVNEKMYIFDYAGPNGKILVFDTTSANGTSPPLLLSHQPLTPITDIVGSEPTTDYIPKIAYLPIAGQPFGIVGLLVFIRTAFGVPYVIGEFVNASGGLAGDSGYSASVTGIQVDYTVAVDPDNSTSYIFVAGQHGNMTQFAPVFNSQPGTYFDYRTPIGLPSTTGIIKIDVPPGTDLLSVVLFDTASNLFSFGTINQNPLSWRVNPQAFTGGTDVTAVVGLTGNYTTEISTTSGPTSTAWVGDPPPFVEDKGPFVGTGGFGTNPVICAFPGFLGPQQQTFVCDTIGNLFTTQDPQSGGFQYVMTFPHPVNVLLGVLQADATYPPNDQYGIWALAPQVNGLAHLYRYSFTSATLIDIAFFQPSDRATLTANSSITATLSTGVPVAVSASIVADSFVIANDREPNIALMAAITADSNTAGGLSQHYALLGSVLAGSSMTAHILDGYPIEFFGDSAFSSGLITSGTSSVVDSVFVIGGVGTLQHNEAFNNFNVLIGAGDFILSGARARASQVHILSGPNAGFYPILFVDSATKLHINASLSHPGPVNYVIKNFRFSDASAHFITRGVTPAHVIVVARPSLNAGRYAIASVDSETRITLSVLSGGDPMPDIPESGMAYDIVLPLFMNLTVQGGALATGGNSNLTGFVEQAATGVQPSSIGFTPPTNAIPVPPVPKSSLGPGVKYQITPPRR